MLRRKTAKIAAAVLSVLLVLSFAACEDTARKEEERVQAEQERIERARQRAAEREKIQKSALFTSARDYVLDVLAEVSPDCEYTVELDENGYFGATDETLAGVIDTADAARTFFDSGYRLLIDGNWRDVYGNDPKPLLEALMERGISGGLEGQSYTFDAGTGEVQFHPTPGV